MSDEDEGDQGYQVVFDDEPEKIHKHLPAKDGKARAKFSNNDTYYGHYKDGKRHGKGEYRLASGAVYNGEYVENKKQGWGIFTAPDGGKYTGEWLNDKRHGKGTYAYPSGDSYTGEWANGMKHGWGTYVYAHLSSSMSGTWSNGQLVDGSWKIHDGSKYVGSFLSNQPAGEGLIKYPSGVYSSGTYANQKFISEFFQRVHPNAKPPKSNTPDAFKKACRAVDKCVSKADQCNSMNIIKETVKGCPNFRRIGTSPVYCCGQPTVDGFKAAVEVITGAGLEKVLWINNRPEPLVYVNSLPFAPRDRRDLVKPLKLSNVTIPQITELETRFMENIKFMAKKKGGLHYYHEDYTDPTDPDMKRIELKTTEVTAPEAVKSMAQVLDALTEEELPITFQRIPLEESVAPDREVFDKFVTIVKNQLEGGALVLNDTLGVGICVSASVIGFLLTNKGGGGDEGDEPAEEAAGDEGDEGDGADKKADEEEKHVYDPANPDASLGEFGVVMELVEGLNGPDPEEERKRLEEEARVKQEEEEQKAAEKAAEEAAKKAAEEAEKAAAAATEGEENAEGEEKKEGEGEAVEDKAEDEGDQKPAEEEEEKPAEEDPEEEKEPEKPKNPPDYGFTCKAKVDEALDKCGQVVNLMEEVIKLKTEFQATTDEARQETIKGKAHIFLQLYFNLILFASYVDKNQPLEFEKAFSAWVTEPEQAELTQILGTLETGALASFEWE